MRRFLAGSLASVAFTATFLVLPVYADPGPQPVPVETSSEEIDLGSVAAPAPQAEVQEGTTDPVAGVSDTAPVLTISRTGVDQFSLVGVTWAQDPAVVDVRVQVRVQDAAGAWGDWTEVGPEDAAGDAEQPPGAPALRGGTSPLWTGPSTGVEVELVTRSGAAPSDVQLDLVDPGRSAADSNLGTPDITDTADAAMAMPDVYSRAQWGADERIRTWAPEYASTIKAATLHHTADTNNYTADQVPQMMRSIYAYHTKNLGWGDIGYNVIVDKFGRLWEGRYGGLASTVIGAHAGGFNTYTFGVSMLGNYDVVDTPQPMIDSVAAIIAWKFSLYGIDPRGTTTLVSSGGGTAKYARGTPVTLPTIFGHRDVGSTVCPGRYGYARLPEIRDKVAATLSGQQPSISSRYSSDAAFRQVVGAKVGSEQVTAGVTVQQFEHAYAYWTPATGAHFVMGQIWGVYMDAGGPAGLGAPTTDELPTPDGVGRFNAFTGDASVYWSPATGAQLVRGQIRILWAGMGWEAGRLGYPVSGELAGYGGRYSVFQGGVVYWTPTGGAVEVHGDIGRRWLALGGLDWAVPTSSESALGSGRQAGAYNTFAGNRSVYWSPATGARVVAGVIRDRYSVAGGPTGTLGYPTTEELAGPGGVPYEMFQNGGVYVTSPATAYAVQGPIFQRWLAQGGWGSGFGLPTSNELTTPDGVGRFTLFSGNVSIYWTPVTGAHSVQGQIRDRWAQMGWELSPLGYPTSDELTTADGRSRYSTFQNGAVYWTPARGPMPVYGEIYRRYAAMGWMTSPLGHPTSGEYAVPGGRANDFEHGRITWTAATGTVTVSYF